MSFTLIHTSDWHLGRQFHNHSLLEDQRHLLEQLFKILSSTHADALLIAGDIYDRSVPPASAVSLLNSFLERVFTELNIPVVIIPGNHDSAERLGFGAHQLRGSGLHIIADFDAMLTPVTLEKAGETIDIWGIPYADPEHVRNHFADDDSIKERITNGNFDAAHTYLIEQINQRRDPSRQSILMSHCFAVGGEVSDSERPLSIGGSDQVSTAPMLDFDYVALGHLHGPQSRTKETIRYSGSLMKYSFSEQHQRKGVVELHIGQQIETAMDWHDLHPIHNMRIIEGKLDELIKAGENDPHAHDYLLVRLTDTHALLDPMQKLRQVYPNVMHLEKPGFYSDQSPLMQKREQLKRGSEAMFADFFAQITGNTLTSEQQHALHA